MLRKKMDEGLFTVLTHPVVAFNQMLYELLKTLKPVDC